jgi:hypothetical protein
MPKEKNKWVSIGILRVTFDRLKKLIVKTGDPSVSEYVRRAIDMREQYDISKLEDEVKDEY